MRYALDPLIVAIRSELLGGTPLSFDGTNLAVYTAIAIDNLIADGIPVVTVTPVNILEVDNNKDDFNQSYEIEIEVFTKFAVGLGGWGNNTEVVNQILAKLRPDVTTRLDLSGDNFKVVNQVMESIFPEVETRDDGVLYSTTITITFNVEDLLS